MIETNASEEVLSKADLIDEFLKFRRFFLWRIKCLMPDQDTAEDIFQEACLKFLLLPAVFRFQQAGTKYFCLILQSLALSYLKKSRRIQYRSKLPEVVCEPKGDWDRGLLLERISQAVGTLPVKDRQLLKLYFAPGLKQSEKCKMLQLPSSTMTYQVGKAIAKVRKMVAGGANESLRRSSFWK